jgi:hypothetical protein
VKLLGDILIFLSLIAVLLAIIGAFSIDIWLASTQWLIIAVILSIWAVYLKIRD